MNNDITYYAKHRHSTKAFDSSKKISAKMVVSCGYWLAGDNVMLTMLL